MKQQLKLVAVLGIAIATVWACKKDPVADISTQSVGDNKVAEDGFNDIVPSINERGIKDNGVIQCGKCGVTSGRLNGTTQLNTDTTYKVPADVTGQFITIHRVITLKGTQPIEMESMVYTMTFDNVVDKGVLKTGIIKATLVPNQGYTAVIDGLNPGTGFEVKGIKYSANIAVTNDATNQNKVRVVITNGICTWANGDKVTYESDRTTVIDKATEQVTLWGTVNGVNRKGKKYNIVIDEPTALIKTKTCTYVEKGIQTLTEEGKDAHIIDFGYKTGTCDEFVKVTIGKNAWEYDMAKTTFTKL